MMIKKISGILQSVLFSWIVLFGIVYAHPECRNLLSSLCHQGKFLISTDSTTVSGFPYKPHHASLDIFAAAKDDFCCKVDQCEADGDIFYNVQYPETQKLSVNFIDIIFSPGDKSKRIKQIFDHYRFTQATPIYILKQSFLC